MNQRDLSNRIKAKIFKLKISSLESYAATKENAYTILNLFPLIPGRLKEVCISLSSNTKYFSQKIRVFNSGMSPSSVQVKYNTVKKHGPEAFKVMGQLFRRIGPILATAGSTDPACLQT